MAGDPLQRFVFVKKNNWVCDIFHFSLLAVYGYRKFSHGTPSGNKHHLLNLSSENNPSCLGYIGDYTTQLYWDYNEPL